MENIFFPALGEERGMDGNERREGYFEEIFTPVHLLVLVWLLTRIFSQVTSLAMSVV